MVLGFARLTNPLSNVSGHFVSPAKPPKSPHPHFVILTKPSKSLHPPLCHLTKPPKSLHPSFCQLTKPAKNLHPHLCHTGKAKKTVFCTLCHTDKASEKATRTLCHLDKANEKADKAFCHLDKANEKADKALCHTDKTYETAAKTLCNFDKHRERLTPLALTVRQRHRKVRTPHFATPAKAYMGLHQRYRERHGNETRPAGSIPRNERKAAETDTAETHLPLQPKSVIRIWDKWQKRQKIAKLQAEIEQIKKKWSPHFHKHNKGLQL